MLHTAVWLKYFHEMHMVSFYNDTTSFHQNYHSLLCIRPKVPLSLTITKRSSNLLNTAL